MIWQPLHENLAFLLILTTLMAIANESSAEPAPINSIPSSWPSPVMDNEIYSFSLIDLLEYSTTSRSRNDEAASWDALARVGTDNNGFWIKSEGTKNLNDADGEVDVQGLYAYMLSAFFDLQMGIQYESILPSKDRTSRVQGVIGIQGLAPYSYDLDVALFIGQKGETSGRLSAEGDFYLGQKAVLQARMESSASDRKIEDFDMGIGFNKIEFGVRTRYEISREFAPYIGVTWTGTFGETRDIAMEKGDDPDLIAFVGGLRVWY